MAFYDLTPWADLSEEARQTVISQKGTDVNTGNLIDPKIYEKASFYTKDGQIPPGKDVDEWLRLGKPDNFTAPSVAGVAHPVQDNYTYQDSPVSSGWDRAISAKATSPWQEKYNNLFYSTSDASSLWGPMRKSLVVDKIYGYDEDGNPIYWTDTGYFKDQREVNQWISNGLASIVLGGGMLGNGYQILPQLGKSLWNAGKTYITNWMTNPILGAYDTLKLGSSIGIGYGGSKTVDAITKAFTGKTWGEGISDITGLPTWVGDTTNPGGLVAVPFNKYLNGVERRGVEMAMRTGSGGDGLKQIASSFPTRFPAMTSRLEYAKELLPGIRDKAKYLFTGRASKNPGYNSLLWGKDPQVYQGYTGRGLYDGDNIVKETSGDIIDYTLNNKDINPLVGHKALDQSPGIHAEYVAKNYGKPARVIETNTHAQGPIEMSQSWYDKLVSDLTPGVTKTNKTGLTRTQNGSLTAASEGEIPLIDSDGRMVGGIDAGGHLTEYRQNPVTKQIELRQQDIWKFKPEDYEAKWFTHTPEGWTKEQVSKAFRWESPRNMLLDAGLRVVDRNVTKAGPVIFRTPWRTVKPYDNNPIDLNPYM